MLHINHSLLAVSYTQLGAPTMAAKFNDKRHNDAPLFDHDDDDDEEYYYSDRLPVEGRGRMKLCAYGSSNFAIVISGFRLEIFDPRKQQLIFRYDLETTWLWAKSVTFTSLIADNDNFFLSTSNGNIFSCLKTESGYIFIRPEKGFPGFLVTEQVVTKHDKASAILKPEKLLGSNDRWFVYQDDYKRIVCLRKAYGEVLKGPVMIGTFSKTFGKEIKAHAFSDAGVLWVATEEIEDMKTVSYLYQINPSFRTIKKYSWEEQNEEDVLLAVSTKGDVALETRKGIFVFRPEISRLIGDPIPAGDDKVWTCGLACFATRNDREYFICSGVGTKSIEVLERKMNKHRMEQNENDEVWEPLYFWERSCLEEEIGLKLDEHKLTLTHPGMNDKGMLFFEYGIETYDVYEHGIWWFIPSKA